MLERRVEPAEKKSQGNAERHFRFPMYALSKNDGNLTDAQRSTRAQHGLENYFETAGLWREFQQSGMNDGKETAHGVMNTSERMGQVLDWRRRSCWARGRHAEKFFS